MNISIYIYIYWPFWNNFAHLVHQVKNTASNSISPLSPQSNQGVFTFHLEAILYENHDHYHEVHGCVQAHSPLRKLGYRQRAFCLGHVQWKSTQGRASFVQKPSWSPRPFVLKIKGLSADFTEVVAMRAWPKARWALNLVFEAATRERYRFKQKEKSTSLEKVQGCLTFKKYPYSIFLVDFGLGQHRKTWDTRQRKPRPCQWSPPHP